MTKAVPEPQPQPEPEPEPKAKRHNRILFWILVLLLGGISSWVVAERLGRTEPVVDSVVVDSVPTSVAVTEVYPHSHPNPFNYSGLDSRIRGLEKQQARTLGKLDTVLIAVDRLHVRHKALVMSITRLADDYERRTARVDEYLVALAATHNRLADIVQELTIHLLEHEHEQGYHH